MFLVATAIAATVLPPVLGMHDALRLFRENGFDLLLADAQVAVAQADLAAASAVANPQLGGSVGKTFDYDAAACAGCSDIAWSVGVTDPSALSDLLSGKRGLRRDVALAALSAARHTREDALRALSLQVRQGILDAALAQGQREVTRELAASTERTRALNERRLRAGAISEAELARSEVAALEALQAMDLSEQALRTAKLQVAFLLGVREPLVDFELDPAVLEAPLPAGTAPVEALAGEALQRRPDLLAASDHEVSAESAAAAARRQRVPDVAVSLQYQQQGSGQNALQPPTVTVGAQLPLPIFDQQQGPVGRADAEVRARRIAQEKLRAQVLLDVQAARAAVEANRRLVDRMRARVLGRAERVRDLVQVQYEKGAASLLELLDAQRTWAQTRAEYLKDLHDFWLSLFQLDAAIGRT